MACISDQRRASWQLFYAGLHSIMSRFNVPALEGHEKKSDDLFDASDKVPFIDASHISTPEMRLRLAILKALYRTPDDLLGLAKHAHQVLGSVRARQLFHEVLLYTRLIEWLPGRRKRLHHANIEDLRTAHAWLMTQRGAAL